jgi:hypothetical protein
MGGATYVMAARFPFVTGEDERLPKAEGTGERSGPG